MFTISGIRNLDGAQQGWLVDFVKSGTSAEMTQKAEGDSSPGGWNHPEMSSLICPEIHPGCPLRLQLLTGSPRALSSGTAWASSQRGSWGELTGSEYRKRSRQKLGGFF